MSARAHWLIHFDEDGKSPEIFTDEGAAWNRYAQCLVSWSCTLFAQVIFTAPSKGQEAEPRCKTCSGTRLVYAGYDFSDGGKRVMNPCPDCKPTEAALAAQATCWHCGSEGHPTAGHKWKSSNPGPAILESKRAQLEAARNAFDTVHAAAGMGFPSWQEGQDPAANAIAVVEVITLLTAERDSALVQLRAKDVIAAAAASFIYGLGYTGELLSQENGERLRDEARKSTKLKEWDGAEFCGLCNELLLENGQVYCHKCGAKLLCDHDRGFTEYCEPCGRIHATD